MATSTTSVVSPINTQFAGPDAVLVSGLCWVTGTSGAPACIGSTGFWFGLPTVCIFTGTRVEAGNAGTEDDGATCSAADDAGGAISAATACLEEELLGAAAAAITIVPEISDVFEM